MKPPLLGMLLLAGPALATDSATVIAGLGSRAAECRYMKRLCTQTERALERMSARADKSDAASQRAARVLRQRGRASQEYQAASAAASGAMEARAAAQDEFLAAVDEARVARNLLDARHGDASRYCCDTWAGRWRFTVSCVHSKRRPLP